MPSQLCGVDILSVELIVSAAYLALGIWLFSRWACRDEKPIPPWKFGDPPRRPGKSLESRVLEHLGGAVVFMSICAFGLSSLGIG